MSGNGKDDKYVGKDVFGNSVFMAETDEVQRLTDYVDQVLWAIAPHMGWSDLDHVFVSDMSEIHDFHLSDEELEMVSQQLGFKVRAEDYVYEVAEKLKAVSP